jgi:hypothetical protein
VQTEQKNEKRNKYEQDLLYGINNVTYCHSPVQHKAKKKGTKNHNFLAKKEKAKTSVVDSISCALVRVPLAWISRRHKLKLT